MKFDNPTSFNIVQSGNFSLDGHGCCWMRFIYVISTERFIEHFLRHWTRWTTFARNVGFAQAQLGIEPCGHCTGNSRAALLSGVGFVWTSPFNIVQSQSTLLDPGTIFKIDGSLNSHFSLANWLLALEHFKTFTETASNSQVKLSTASSFKYLIISTVLPAESYVRAISVHFH